MTILEKVRTKIYDYLMKEYKIDEKSILNYVVSTEDNQEHIDITVCTENEEYVFSQTLIKNEEESKANGKKNTHPVFPIDELGILVEIKNVAIKGYELVDHITADLVHLEAILNCLASNHSRYIADNSVETAVNKQEYSLIKIRYKKNEDAFINLVKKANTKDIDENLLKEGIEKLLDSCEETLKQTNENVYVRSDILKSKLFFKHLENQTLECKIVNIAPQTCVPIVYDVLLAVFSFSDQQLRQCYFHQLLDMYYNTLQTKLEKLNLDLSTILPIEAYQLQIKQLIPYVKLERVVHYTRSISRELRTHHDGESDNWKSLNAYEQENSFQEAVKELYECTLYTNLNREDCYKIVRNKIGSNNYKFISWTITALEERPGFSGDYFRLKINISHRDEDKTLHLFAKYLPSASNLAKDFAIINFKKEHFIYDTFITKINELGLEELTDFLPKCYFSRPNDVLILDDMSLLNYSSFPTGDLFSYETTKLIIRQLAKFHACSILYEEILSERAGRKVKIDEEYEEYVREVYLQTETDSVIKEAFTCGMNSVLNYILDAFPDVPKEITMEEFKEKVRETYDALITKKVKKHDKYVNVICQGDFWGNNIMFQFNEDNTPINCCILDYQITRYCPPTNDLMCLIYINLDKQTRTKYMSKILDEYYTELSKNCFRYNLDLNNIYTYEDFLDSCNYMKSAAISVAAFYLPITLCPAEKMQKVHADQEKLYYSLVVDRKELVEDVYKEGPYREKLREIVEDLYDICKNDSI